MLWGRSMLTAGNYSHNYNTAWTTAREGVVLPYRGVALL